MVDGCVRRMQRILNHNGENLVEDGVFSSATAAAVKRFKVKAGLTNTDLVGPKTKLKLEFATGAMRDRVAAYALKAYNGEAMGSTTYGQWNGGDIDYDYDGSGTYGGGHGARPGPSNLDYYRTPNPDSGVLDCSGFTRWAHSLAYGYSGRSNPHGNWDTRGIRTYVPRASQLDPGDIIVWRNASNTAGHVAIYIGGGDVVHSTSASGKDGPTITTIGWVDSGYLPSGGTRTYHNF